jgi:hypothetical protein
MKSIVKQAAALMAMPVIVLACCRAVSALIPAPTEFETSRDLKEFALANGLVFHCGNGNGIFYNNYYLADHPLALDDFPGVATRRDCGLTPAWHGVLWVCQLGTSGPYPELIGGKWRIWGHVLVAGDPKLMDRIEELYRNHQASGAPRR